MKKYNATYLLFTTSFILLFWMFLSLNSCQRTIYYSQEYIRHQEERKELDSLNKIKMLESKRVQDSVRNLDKQAERDTVQARRKSKIDKRKAQKTKRLEAKKQKLEKIEQQKKADEEKRKALKKDPVKTQDSTTPTQPKQDSTQAKSSTSDTTKKANTSIPSDSIVKPKEKKVQAQKPKEFKISKDAVKEFITQNASEFATVDEEGNVKLVGDVSNMFKNMNLVADTIVYNYIDKLMVAIPQKDSLKSLVKKINFNQGQKNFRMDGMLYNPMTQKALFENVQTKEGELFIHAEKVRQDNDSVFFGQNALFTTCNYFPPHFSFKTYRYKMVKERTIVTGSLYPFVEGAPLLPPNVFILPFSILPMPKQRSSGLIIPNISWAGPLGFGITNGGYYLVPSPYWDLKMMGSYYTQGFDVSLASNFLKKYKFNGNASVSFLYKKTGNRGDAGFTENISYDIKALFSLDRAVNPTITFSTNLNYRSDASFGVYVANQNLSQRLDNTFGSNINFSKRFERGYIESINVALGMSQNTSTQELNFGQFPAFRLQTRIVNPIYYFFTKQKNLGTKWYDKLTFGYSIDVRSSLKIKQDDFTIVKFIDNLEWGATQSFPLTLSLPKTGPVLISPNISYSQELVGRQTNYKWNSEATRIDTLKLRGIFPRHSLLLGASFNIDDLTATAQFGEKARLKALRYVLRLTPGINYTPDVKAWEFVEFKADTSGKKRRVNIFDGSEYRKQESGSISFSMNHILKVKWMQKIKKEGSDTAFTFQEKKIDLINVGVSTSYDLIADSFNLANFALNYTTRISEQVSLSGSASFDPYRYENGIRSKKLLWETGSLGFNNLLNFSISFGYTFKGGQKNSKTNSSKLPSSSETRTLGSAYPNEKNDIINQTYNHLARMPDQFVDFSIPWSLNMSLSASYARGAYNVVSKSFNETVVANANLNGDVSLTEKWKLTARGSLNLTTGELTSVEVGLIRDLHCWTMSISIIPIGPLKQFKFIIRPRSSILQDLKIEQVRNLF